MSHMGKNRGRDSMTKSECKGESRKENIGRSRYMHLDLNGEKRDVQMDVGNKRV